MYTTKKIPQAYDYFLLIQCLFIIISAIKFINNILHSIFGAYYVLFCVCCCTHLDPFIIVVIGSINNIGGGWDFKSTRTLIHQMWFILLSLNRCLKRANSLIWTPSTTYVAFSLVKHSNDLVLESKSFRTGRNIC